MSTAGARPEMKITRLAAEHGTVCSIEGRRAAAPSTERRAALAAQRGRLVSADTKVGRSRHEL